MVDASGDTGALASGVRQLCTHDHLCIVYESREEQLAALVPFLRLGLERGDRCFYVADSPNFDAVGLAMRARGLDVDGAVARGALALATERQTYLAAGEFDPEAMIALARGAAAKAVDEGYRGLHIAGEMTWALGDRTRIERLMRYEELVNEHITRSPVTAVCQYDRRRFSPEVIRDVIRTHPLIAIGGRVCRNFYYVPPGDLVGPDRLHREVDRLLENIAERERAEDALRASERRLQLAGRLAAVGALAASVAHEVNNPLAYVTANVGYLVERLSADEPGGRDELRRAAAEALDGAQRVRDVVQGLRRFSGPAPGTERGPVDLAAEIQAAAAITRHQVEARARLVLDVAPALPAVVAGRHELGQVVVNLVVNAAQAIPEGNAAANEVRVQARAEGGRVVLEVRDTGSGIPADALSRIFEPFYTTRQPGGGSGLGLAVCHGIVAAAGGKIEVESAPGRGTTFRIELPAAAPGAAPAQPAPRGAVQGRRLRVLVLDDDVLVGRAAARLLAGEHDVELATSGADVARRAEAGERWDVLLCDLVMPEVTGMDLAERLTRTAPELASRMVFMTGGAYTEGSRAFLADPGRRHLEKPFEPADLRAAVRAAAGTT